MVTLLSVTLLLLSFIPHELMADTSGWFTQTHRSAADSRENIEEEALHIVSTFIIGLCSSALFIITVTYVAEISKTKSRGYEIAKALRFVAVGSVSALVILLTVATWFNGGFHIKYDVSALEYWKQNSHHSDSQTLGVSSASKKFFDSSSHSFAPWRVRIIFLVPALLCIFVAAGILLQPDSPYWLMAYRTPYGNLYHSKLN
jgi:MFS family permease